MFLSICIGFVALRSVLLFIFAWRNYTTTERKPVNFIAHLIFSSADVLVVFWAVAYILQDRF